VKAHRGEPANEGADILADKAISDPREDCSIRLLAPIGEKKPCRQAGNVTYQNRHPTLIDDCFYYL